jgi:hypothetical protein
MSTFSNELKPAEEERLALLMEEASDVIKACAKILRHGYESINPDRIEDGANRFQLSIEVGQLQHAIQLIMNDLYPDTVTIERTRRKKSVEKYLHHQR